ncbi:MAG: DUF2339 domain-containing protein [Phycisphaerales bacterium]|nr:DUF2339 domain-containing protein [Phycisphaerales bacterium]
MSDDIPPTSSSALKVDVVFSLRQRVDKLEALLHAHGIAIPSDAPPAFIAPPPPIPVSPEEIAVLRGTPPQLPPSSVERFVGVKLAAIAGALAVLGAIAYFIKYAIDAGLFGRLGPESKFGASLAVAAIFLVAAETVRARYSLEASRALFCAGVVSLFAAVFGGAFMLQLFGPGYAALLVSGAGLVGAAAAVRSNSPMVGVLSLLGGIALPIVNGFSEGALLVGIELTVVLVIAVVVTSLGTMSFARVRDVALVGGVPLSIAWAAEANPSSTESALFIVLWWGILAGSCVFEAMRGRSAIDNSVTLAAASAAALLGLIVSALLGSIGAAGGGSSFSDPLAYLPLLIGGGLAIAAFQLRAIGQPMDDDERAADPSEIDAGAVACQMLSSVAMGCAPLAVLTALGVFLDGTGMAIGAAGVATLLAFGMHRTRSFALLPACILASFFALFASLYELLSGPSVIWSTPSWTFANASKSDLMAYLFAVHITVGQIGGAVAIVLLFLPLVLGAWPRALAASMAGLASLLFLVLTADMFGPFLLCAAHSAIVFALVFTWRDGSRLTKTARLSLGIWHALIALIAMWTGEIWCAQFEQDSWSDVALLSAMIAIPHAATMSLRVFLTSRAIGWLDAIVALLMTAATAYLVLAHAYGRHSSADSIIVGLILTLAACSGVIALLAYWRRSLALGRAAAIAALPGLFVVSQIALLIVFTDRQSALQGSTAWEFAAFAPLVTLLFSRKVLRALGATAITSQSTKSTLQGVALASFVAACVVVISALFDGQPGAAMLVSLLGVSAIGCLLWGFKCAVAGARWVGLGLLALLALRLIFIDLAQTSALVRVLLLFVAGVVLVGTSIAYAVLRPKPNVPS